jgi:hypothetical protein
MVFSLIGDHFQGVVTLAYRTVNPGPADGGSSVMPAGHTHGR